MNAEMISLITYLYAPLGNQFKKKTEKAVSEVKQRNSKQNH